MVCLVCHIAGAGSLCQECRAGLRQAPEHILPGGLRLIAAFEHTGSAAALVHLLKYRGVTGYADMVARVVSPRLPRLPVVPVPRVLSRRLRYGVDPALEIARNIAVRLDVAVLPMLRPPLHARRRAGGDHSAPGTPFVARFQAPAGVIVVDDVVTTGATILTASQALGRDRVALAVSANVVPTVSSLLAPESDMRRSATQWPRS